MGFGLDFCSAGIIYHSHHTDEKADPLNSLESADGSVDKDAEARQPRADEGTSSEVQLSSTCPVHVIGGTHVYYIISKMV